MAKKGQSPKSKFWIWIERIGDFRIFSISVEGWGCILSIVLLIGGLAALGIRDNSTTTQETVVAEVLWATSMLAANEGGAEMIYRVRLKQGEEEYTCRISPVLAKLWQSLEQGKRYEFSISRTRSRCFIFEATALDSTDYLFE